MKTLPVIFSLLPLTLAAEESYRVFMDEQADAEHIRQVVQSHIGSGPEVKCEYITLPAECKTQEQARTQARAIECGITGIPALVITDEQGPFATLPLRDLTAEKLQEARANKDTSGRREDAQKHRFHAHLFLTMAQLSIATPDDQTLATCIEECRKLLQHPQATPDLRQLIGLRMLYPALMEQYKRGYRQSVAHNPATEAKLLEAIAALEAARDINADTPLGRQAFAERERLRAARRKSRQYE